MFKRIKTFLLICLIANTVAVCQISQGGLPKSFAYPSIISSEEIIDIKIDVQKLNETRKDECKEGCAKHVGNFIENEISIKDFNRKIIMPDGSVTYLISFRLEEAQAVGISFSEIFIPENAKLFVYNSSFQDVYGSFDQSNVLKDGSFTIRPVSGNVIHLEINCEKENAKELYFVIDGFAYFFETDFFNNNKSSLYGESGDCQVNINCPEGLSVRKTADAVVKIIVYGSGSYFLCTGTLVNNTKQDRTPYLLSAQHCARYTNAVSQYHKWQFYFSYEVPECTGIQTPIEDKTLIGCSPVALMPLEYPNSSDFLLVKLLDSIIPSDYNPYFAGWDATDNNVSEAKSVHHPNGDVKKVSVTNTFSSSMWPNSNSTKQTHLRVIWEETESGYGTTEGGSSGAPLLNQQGNIIGTLTGGDASCNRLTGPDYYGKFSFSWKSNDVSGNDSTRRLDCWLDPIDSGSLTLEGFSDNINVGSLMYSLNNSTNYAYGNPTIIVGDKILFKASLYGDPDFCYWEFEGAEPSFSNEFEPKEIVYNNYGQYSINLTLYKEGFTPKVFTFYDYVKVTPDFFPNPFENMVTIVFSKEIDSNVEDLNFKEFRLIDMNGKKAHFPNKIERKYNILNLYFDNLIDGVYILQLVSEENIINIKLLKTNNNQ
ncbi:MAG: T9SS type A sorting domain-containing protein [Bacteroidales bacterium]|jgi:hypothetical protein|nr:T9SS type A sorting domain-containing protein [Bacteroidales bacterium]